MCFEVGCSLHWLVVCKDMAAVRNIVSMDDLFLSCGRCLYLLTGPPWFVFRPLVHLCCVCNALFIDVGLPLIWHGVKEKNSDKIRILIVCVTSLGKKSWQQSNDCAFVTSDCWLSTVFRTDVVSLRRQHIAGEFDFSLTKDELVGVKMIHCIPHTVGGTDRHALDESLELLLDKHVVFYFGNVVLASMRLVHPSVTSSSTDCFRPMVLAISLQDIECKEEFGCICRKWCDPFTRCGWLIMLP